MSRPDHHPRHEAEPEAFEKGTQRQPVELCRTGRTERVAHVDVVCQRAQRLVPARQVGSEAVVERERHGPSAHVEQTGIVVTAARDRAQRETEQLDERHHLTVTGVDELGATLAPLAVRERVALHPPTDAVACFEHHHVTTGTREQGGALQAGEAGADDDDIGTHQNSVGCSGRTIRGAPVHGT